MIASSSIIGCASSGPSPAAELIAVNTDLLTEILLCLPATSLIRFKSVSKHWLSLISDSRFAIRHAARNPRPSSALGLFLLRNSALPGKPTYLSLQGHPNPPSLDFLDGIVGPSGVFPKIRSFPKLRSFPKIHHSSNGLLLCEYPCRIHPDVLTSRYLVCNPTTRSYNVLPYRILPRMLLGFLAFDPSKSPHYKVVVMSLYPSVRINIYFSESSSWKEFHPPTGTMATCVNSVVLCSGVIYWICERNAMSILGFYMSILGFDIDSEKMLEKLPNPQATGSIRYFGELAGRLILIQSISPSAVVFRILEMDKDHLHWIVKFQALGKRFIYECDWDEVTGAYGSMEILAWPRQGGSQAECRNRRTCERVDGDGGLREEKAKKVGKRGWGCSCSWRQLKISLKKIIQRLKQRDYYLALKRSN